MEEVTPEQLIERANRIGELAEAEADRADREAGFSDELRQAVHDAGLHLLLRPKRYGGYGFGPRVFSETVRAVARHNTAAAWVSFFMSLHEQWVAFLPPEGRKEIYDSDGFVADIFFPIGKVEYVDGGVRLSGQWNFGSGVLWCKWIGLGAIVEVPGFGDPQPCLVTVDTSELEVVRNWDTFGLRGTGSHGVKVDGVFVPWRRVLPLAHLKSTGQPLGGEYDEDEPIYREPFMPSFCLGFGAMCLGSAERVVDELRRRIRERQRVLLGMKEWESPIAQRNLGECAVELAKIEAMHQAYIQQLEDWVAANTPLVPAEDSNRLGAWRSSIAKMSSDLAFRSIELLGGMAAYKGDYLERTARDLFMVSLQVGQLYDDNMMYYGRTQYGLGGHPLL